jgi:hypothetical protein
LGLGLFKESIKEAVRDRFNRHPPVKPRMDTHRRKDGTCLSTPELENLLVYLSPMGWEHIGMTGGFIRCVGGLGSVCKY